MSAIVQIPECDVPMALQAPICLGCGGAKLAGAALCESCFLCLPLYLRDWITKPGDRLFPETLRRALGLLADLRLLRNRRWSYRSMDELERAGYRLKGYGQCESLRCLQQVVWVWTPQHRQMPLDPASYEPHSAVCLDPVGVVLRRVRRLQTIASGRKKLRRRA